MKKCVVIIFCIVLAGSLLAGCASGAPQASTPPPSASAAPSVSVAPSPSEPPAPDFSGKSFVGNWAVAKVTASDGSPASESEIKQAGAAFTLELLDDNGYFVYDAKGKVLGQGTYGVEKNKLTLTAGDKTTVYEIVDENTLQSASADGSVTTMSKSKQDSGDAEGEGD